MDELITALEKLFSRNDVKLNDRIFCEDELVSDIENMACDLLITGDGACNWKNIFALRDAGYKVFKGDGDSFGWLVGCISKYNDNRILVYG